MFGWMKSLWPRRAAIAPASPSASSSGPTMRARYDAAATTDDNAKLWANADGLSARAANNPEVRRTIRNRARYEVANNCYARGIVNTLANDVIGTGPRLQLKLKDPAVNERLEQLFNCWAREVRLAQKLRTARIAKCVDGEAFLQLRTNPKLRSPVKLDLLPIECDRVTTPLLNVFDVNKVDGIDFDEHGNPLRYNVLKHHPGDLALVNPLAFDPIPAEFIIHWFRSDRAGQYRGVSEIGPALPLFGQLRRFTLATIDAAETAAMFAGILKTLAPPDDGADEVDPFTAVELQRRMLVTAPAGYGMEQMKAEHPTTTYPEFKREIINEAARCVHMPYNIAACNSSSYNYSSGRMDHQTYGKSNEIDRDDCDLVVLERVFVAFFDEASLIPGLIPEGLGPFDQWPREFHYDGSEHVDPSKEADAQATRLDSNTTTLAREYAKQGLDWEKEIRQRAAELELCRTLKITPQEAMPPAGGAAPDKKAIKKAVAAALEDLNAAA